MERKRRISAIWIAVLLLLALAVTADALTGTMTLGGNGGSIRLFLVTADGWKPLGAARELCEQSV